MFNYILTLTANDFTVEETRECIRILNKFVLKQPLSDDELEVILRDDAFQKPVFFLGSTFLFDKFAVFMKNTAHVIKINGQLHIYKDGVYSNGYKEIESNIGDDIGDDFLQGSQVSVFKKIVTGNRIKAERKGQDPFEFNPFIKLLFSANDIPRMKDKTGAVLRRLVIIPFNATFSKDDPDYRPFIKYELTQQDSIEYLIRLGVEGLKRVVINNGFSKSDKVQNQLDEYEQENNPILAFINDTGVDMIENEPTNEVYKRYQVFCADNSMQPMSNIVFSKQINKRLDLEISVVKLNGQTRRIFRSRKDGD